MLTPTTRQLIDDVARATAEVVRAKDCLRDATHRLAADEAADPNKSAAQEMARLSLQNHLTIGYLTAGRPCNPQPDPGPGPRIVFTRIGPVHETR